MKSYIDVVSMQKQAAISQSLLREKAKRYDEVIGKKAGLADIVAKMKQYFSGKQPAVPVAAPAVPVRQGAPAGYDGLTAEGPIISRGTGYDRARAALEPRPSDMLAPVSMATPTNLINAVQVGDPPESEVRAVTGLDAATPFEKQRINQPVSRAMTNALPVWEKARAAVDNEPYYSPAQTHELPSWSRPQGNIQATEQNHLQGLQKQQTLLKVAALFEAAARINK